MGHPHPLLPLPALALFTVARPLAKPTPLPLVPLDLNIGAFLARVSAQDVYYAKSRRDAPQHIRHNEEPDMTASNVDLIQVADSAISRSDCDVFELDIHVVFRLDQLPSIDLSGGDFEGHDVVLQIFVLAFMSLNVCNAMWSYLGFVQQFDGYADRARHGCGSFPRNAVIDQVVVQRAEGTRF